MNSTVTVFEVKFLTLQLVLPSINHVNTFLDKYHMFLTSDLLDSMRILPMKVSTNSKTHKTAIHNSICLES